MFKHGFPSSKELNVDDPIGSYYILIVYSGLHFKNGLVNDPHSWTILFINQSK